MIVRFDGRTTANIIIPATYAINNIGMCAPCDDEHDYILANGTSVRHLPKRERDRAIGDSHYVNPPEYPETEEM